MRWASPSPAPCPTRSSTSPSASSAARWGPGPQTATSTGSSDARASTPTGPGSASSHKENRDPWRGPGPEVAGQIQRSAAVLRLVPLVLDVVLYSPRAFGLPFSLDVLTGGVLLPAALLRGLLELIPDVVLRPP